MVNRFSTGKHRLSEKNMINIMKEFELNLVEVSRKFLENKLDECYVEKADLTHFVINVGNGRTFGSRDDEDVI